MDIRVAVFTEVLPPANDEIAHVSYDLLRSLAEQQHEIRVFSTYVERGELPVSQNRIEVLRPFRSWSLLEIPRLIPLMFDFKPDLIHIIHPRAQMMNFGWAKLTSVLPQLARLNHRTPVVTSLYGRLKPSHESKLMPLLRTSDLITVSQPGHQHELALNPDLRDKMIRVLPMSSFEMPLASSQETDVADRRGIELFLERYPNFIFIPGHLDLHSGIEELIAHLKIFAESGYGVIVGSSPSRLELSERRKLETVLHRDDWGQRVLFTGSLSLAAEDELLREAWLTSLVSLVPESLSFSRYVRAAARRAAPLVLNAAQVAADSLAWEHGNNALIVKTLKDLPQVLAQLKSDSSMCERLRRGGLELSSRQVTDSPANLMSRWYAELLAGREPLRP